MASDSQNQSVAYLLKTFPRLSETFILNEILGLEKLGLGIAIFSLRRPAAEPVHTDVSKVKSSVTYIPSLSWRFWPGALSLLVLHHLILLLTETRRYLAATKFYFRAKGSSRFEDFLQAAYLARALRRSKFTHLHAHFANTPTMVAEVVHRLTDIPFSFTAHAKDIYLTSPAELTRKIESAACVLTCTEHNRQYLAGLLGRTVAVHLAYHGVDVRRFGARRRFVSTGEPPLILSVGRFCEKKGLKYLIGACRRLVDRGYPFRCQIVGYGELQGKLERMIVDLGLQDCVSLPGRMTQDQLAILYQQAMMFVLPCLVTDQGDRDGIPNVLVEAMVSGVPVISTDVSGISELVKHAQNGLLVEQRNAEALADAMELLLLRSDLRRLLAQNGRETVLRRFTLEASAQHVHDILSTVLGNTNEPAIDRRRAALTGYVKA
jgi:glycosyltransferase involved in cell wall biosynthesis